jgi:omega-6 fatty acid desaturase (delta-12 desaturase)
MVQREVKGLSGRGHAKLPPFKMGDLRGAVPAHCFERSYFKSFLHLAMDLLFIAASLWFVCAVWNPSMLPKPLSWIGWMIFAIIQGSVMTGVWVIAHECGHQAFSPSGLVNDIVGFIFHTMLCVPYFSWKISHAKHHLRTGSMAEDEVFVPRHMSSAMLSDHPLMHTAPMRLLMIVIMLTLGWPTYLAANATAHKTPDFVSHFWPYCSLFSQKEQRLVLLSDAGLVAWGFVLYKLAAIFSWEWILLTYGIPMIVTNSWLVTITALQHTHKDVPHYDAATWNWLRGALTTVDRDYGIFNIVHHHIGDTHIAHHLFHTMPHYHAQEATEALKKVLGEYYLQDSTPIHQALWENTFDCFAVEEDTKDGILWWKRSKYQARKAKH